MALADLIKHDALPESRATWQLAAPLSAEGTALTVAELALGPVLTSNYTVSPNIFVVERFAFMIIQFWGDTAIDNQSSIWDLYGWSEDGPGSHIGRISGRFGNFTSVANTGFHTNAHKSIMEDFDPARAYRGCDSYTTIFGGEEDYESIIDGFPVEADFPTKFRINLTNTQYKYMGMRPTGGTQTGNVAAIFKPLSLKETVPQPAI